MKIVEKLSDLLSLDTRAVVGFLVKIPYKYRVFYIKKRNGNGQRLIAQPTSEVKIIQKLVLKWFDGLPVHPCAKAYKKNIGIKDNARAHLVSNYLLKMDFKDFFPSITPDIFLNHIKKYGPPLSEEDEIFVEKIFFWKTRKNPFPKLSIGAPSSPFISNTILYDFDVAMHKYCTARKITYTRYADDLTFSTNKKNILFEIPDFVNKQINDFGWSWLVVNNEKTKFSSKKFNRHVTGLVLTNDDRLSIGRNKKRYIKSLIYSSTKGQLSCDEKNYLSGYISYIRDVEPAFLDSLMKKYGKLEFD